MKNTIKKVVNPGTARTEEYRKILKTIESENKCPFCPSNFKYHKKPILKKSGGWFITENSWSYKEAKYRFLIISEKHKERLSGLTVKDFATVLRLAKWAVKEFNIPGGALAMRFGDIKFTGATVYHLHFHLISPKINKNGSANVVSFPIG